MASQAEDDNDLPGKSGAGNGDDALASAKETGAAMRDTAAAQAEALSDEAQAAWTEGRGDLNEMVTRAEFAIIDHPLAAVGAAFAAGWLAGKLFR